MLGAGKEARHWLGDEATGGREAVDCSALGGRVSAGCLLRVLRPREEEGEAVGCSELGERRDTGLKTGMC